MGEAVAKGLLQAKATQFGTFEIRAGVRSESAALSIRERFQIEASTDLSALVQWADVVLLCVKPQQAQAVMTPLSPLFDSKKLLISICASLTLKSLREWSGSHCGVVRSMPNTPCVIGKGVTVLCADPHTSLERLKIAELIFSTLGEAVVIDESMMDAATGLSGCGPAYVYVILEALMDAGVKVGLPRKLSSLLAAQMVAGAAQMVIERDEHPSALKDEVTTPSGCTVEGLMALEEGGLRVTLIKAVMAASERSRQIRLASEVPS